MSVFITYLIAILSFANLARIATFIITSDIYNIKNAKSKAARKRWHTPSITVIIPAYNEESTIAEAITSLASSDYPKSKLQIIVANDGSTDNTATIAKECIKNLPQNAPRVRLVNQKNTGKAGAINNVLRKYVDSNLVMCLDADSTLDKRSIRNIVQYFRDRNVIACSSNVNIVEDNTLFSLIQKFEYLIGYQAKRGLALMKVEYIVGGVGSVFRTSIVKKIGLYDTNTLTEDIDLTMKLIVNKRENQRIMYAYDSIAYTQAVHTLKEFSIQRFRWKYGRLQAFLKHKSLFFSRESNHSVRLSWFMLPYVLLQDIVFFFEPVIIGWLLFLIVLLADISILSSAVIVLSGYIILCLWSSSHLSVKERLRLTYYAPTMYAFIYVLSLAEYVALIKSLVRLPNLKKSIATKHVTWTSPIRHNASS